MYLLKFGVSFTFDWNEDDCLLRACGDLFGRLELWLLIVDSFSLFSPSSARQETNIALELH